MARGPLPEPDALKAAKGNPGKRKLAATAPSAVVTKGTKPPHQLNAAALAVWRQIAPELERMNFLRSTDRHAFARYCDTLARFWDVRKKLGGGKVTYWTDSAHGKMQRVNPLFLVEERLAKRLTDLEDRFGLSPASRQQIMLRLAANTPQLPFDQPRPAQGVPGPDGDPAAAQAPPESPIGILGNAKLH
jgi:P27 family predicted phage terminase small subunit